MLSSLIRGYDQSWSMAKDQSFNIIARSGVGEVGGGKGEHMERDNESQIKFLHQYFLTDHVSYIFCMQLSWKWTIFSSTH